jgi:hypothetical protein
VRIFFILLVNLALAAQQPPRFVTHSVATGLRGGYQVVPADLNRDGKPDLIALASGMKDLVWFENPGWQRHVIAGGFTGMINCDAWDSPDGWVIGLATGFTSPGAGQWKKSAGQVFLLRPNKDARAEWSVSEIDKLPTAHRLRWARLDKGKRKSLVNAPLIGEGAEPPDYRARVPLVFYAAPEWRRFYVSEETMGVMHGVFIVNWDGDSRDEILTASFEGIHVHRFGRSGNWERGEIVKGSPAEWPLSGASDVAVGRLGRERFLCSVEPWHGNQVVAYTREGGRWARSVIDGSMKDVHTIITADFERDGRDEIVAGSRAGKGAVVLYRASGRAGAKWERYPVDEGGVTAAACAAADLNGDGRVDLACIGSGSANLNWYENAGR